MRSFRMTPDYGRRCSRPAAAPGAAAYMTRTRSLPGSPAPATETSNPCGANRYAADLQDSGESHRGPKWGIDEHSPGAGFAVRGGRSILDACDGDGTRQPVRDPGLAPGAARIPGGLGRRRDLFPKQDRADGGIEARWGRGFL